MPIYEYACASCGHELEVIQKISDRRLTDCPECGKPELHKKISAAGFRLKGSGWYETDFKNRGEKKEGDKKSDTATSSDQTTGTNKNESSKTTDTVKKSSVNSGTSS